MFRNIKLLAFFNFFTDFRLYSAILILYFAQVSGSYALGMSIFSTVMIFAAIFEVPTGVFSDHIGRKTTIILGAISSVLALTLYAIGFNYWILFLGAIFEGISRSFYSGNNNALLHDTLATLNKKDLYDHYLGKISAMFQAALAVSVVLGSIIAQWSFAWVMWLSVIPQCICVIIAFLIHEPRVHERESTNIYNHIQSSLMQVIKNKKLRLLVANAVLGDGIGESAFSFRSAFIATLWPIWAIGIAKMISFIGGGISFWYSGKLIRKFHAGPLMLFESIYNRCINIISLLFASILSPLLMSSTSFLYGTTDVASNSLMQKEYTDKQRATIGSIASLGSSMVFGIFSIILGSVADAFSPTIALLFAELCSIPKIFLVKKLIKLTT